MSNEKNTYEGMFLLDAGNPDFQAASEPVRAILERREAEVLALNPWEERRLAYIIQGRKRGLYALAYFKADPLLIVEIEHDCRLDERVLRVLILRRDKITDEEINAETPAVAGARRAVARQEAPEKRAADQAAQAEQETKQQREQQGDAEQQAVEPAGVEPAATPPVDAPGPAAEPAQNAEPDPPEAPAEVEPATEPDKQDTDIADDSETQTP